MSQLYSVPHYDNYEYPVSYGVYIRVPGMKSYYRLNNPGSYYGASAKNCEQAIIDFEREYPEGYENPNNKYGPRLFAGPCEQIGNDIVINLESRGGMEAEQIMPVISNYPVFLRLPNESLVPLMSRGVIVERASCQQAIAAFKYEYSDGYPYQSLQKGLFSNSRRTQFLKVVDNCILDEINRRYIITLLPLQNLVRRGGKSKKRKTMKGRRIKRKKSVKRQRH